MPLKIHLDCPSCGYKRLIDASVNNCSVMYPEDDMPPGWEPDYYQKCPRCKKEIGIKKVPPNYNLTQSTMQF